MALGTRRIKSVEDSIRDTDEPEHRLKKHLSGLDLTVFGVGVIIGTGIFVLTGVVARDQAGPAVAISFVIAGVVCGLAALCYAEFASTVPVAGSAYTFSYATFGEFVAWIIGWDLVLELALGAATVAVGWSGYLNQLLDDLGIPLPTSIAGEEATVNIPAVVIVLLMTTVLVLGIKLSSRVTSVIVAIKLAIVLLVIGVGIFYVEAANYSPFVPPAQPAEAGASGWDAPLVQLFGFDQGTFGVGRRHRRGRRRLLRLHRLRHRRHGGRGDAETPAATSRGASSARWPSARCSTWRSRSWSSVCRSTPSSMRPPRWPAPSPTSGCRSSRASSRSARWPA